MAAMTLMLLMIVPLLLLHDKAPDLMQKNLDVAVADVLPVLVLHRPLRFRQTREADLNHESEPPGVLWMRG